MEPAGSCGDCEDIFDRTTSFVALSRKHLVKQLTRVVERSGLQHPTHVQSKTLPAATQGKDVLIRARTGSGKTLAYALPVLHVLLSNPKEAADAMRPLKAVILLPSKELCSQVTSVFKDLLKQCNSTITFENVTATLDKQQQHKVKLTNISSARPISAVPAILVGTPTSLIQYLSTVRIINTTTAMMSTGTPRTGNKLVNRTPVAECLNSLRVIVVDEADLVFGFGYKEEMRKIIQHLPAAGDRGKYQAILCSATLNEDVEFLRSAMLYKPVTIKVDITEEAEPSDDVPLSCTGGITKKEKLSLLKEFTFDVVRSEDKWLLLYACIKLRILPLKCIIFTSTVNRAYGIRLFFDKFSIPATVLSPLLPLMSRQVIIDGFNQNLVQILITSDQDAEEATRLGDSLDVISRTKSAVKRKSAQSTVQSSRTTKGFTSVHSGSDDDRSTCSNSDSPLRDVSSDDCDGSDGDGGRSSKIRNVTAAATDSCGVISRGNLRSNKCRRDVDTHEETSSTKISTQTTDTEDAEDDDQFGAVITSSSSNASSDNEGRDSDGPVERAASAPMHNGDDCSSGSTEATDTDDDDGADDEGAHDYSCADVGDETEYHTAAVNKQRIHSKNAMGTPSDFAPHRGIDFTDVCCVVNFDCPQLYSTYVHRVGRTARGGKSGVAITLFDSKESSKDQAFKSTLANQGRDLHPLNLSLTDISCFRYRVQDVMKGVTKQTVKATRCTELQRDLLSCKRMSNYFEQNPQDAMAIREAVSKSNSKSLKSKSMMQFRHLRHVPEYLIPRAKLPLMHPVEAALDTQLGPATGKPRGSRTVTKRDARRRRARAKRTATEQLAASAAGASKPKGFRKRTYRH
eukprot:Lankesteria_metandrocarpae@DN3734_c0_g1_i1.p1